MKQYKKFFNLEVMERAFEFEKIGNQGVLDAREEIRKLGIPTVYMINDEILYELPDGTITEISPFKRKFRQMLAKLRSN